MMETEQILTICNGCKFASGRSFVQCPVCESRDNNALEVIAEKIEKGMTDEL